MSNDKAAERTTLILKLGRLLAKLHDLANGDAPSDFSVYRVAAATYQHDLNSYDNEIGAFVRVGGIVFHNEMNAIRGFLYEIKNLLDDLPNRGGDEISKHKLLKQTLER